MSEQTDAEWLREWATEIEVADPDPSGIVARDAARLRAIAARLEAEQWRPIETAPKNPAGELWGPLFLAYQEGCAAEVFCCMWGLRPGKGDVDLCWTAVSDSDCLEADPTHWRPLPAPPADAKETGDG